MCTLVIAANAYSAYTLCQTEQKPSENKWTRVSLGLSSKGFFPLLVSVAVELARGRDLATPERPGNMSLILKGARL